MEMTLNLEEIKSIHAYRNQLTELLMEVVEGGASVGFLPPLKEKDAEEYWDHVLNPDVILLVAKMDNEIAGTIQLHLCMKLNGDHRVEIAKLMTHPKFRRKGIARFLMNAAEDQAKQLGRTLVVLDTREGDPSNDLYLSLGYVKAGRIPNFAKSADGSFDATIIYYKSLSC
ncbi:GNAT family N-acetyltransferase [Bacillus sp. 31A1R]|uniref:GNAT family N-acetyltransferase n=1 Tax=Robertmurraya mangrovi TaxID=3098077 RepID=A0ABU5J0N3_9BACI|nr:GNAT family N-acetyltransferase [Bacillus sp. 31A1R]MDZ5472980.1 GNAT family N-acetyltransferase [Bacillus sp. 31A1R]